MKLPVHKSVPVDKIATSPHGKIIAPSKATTPGAFSWNHGETDTDNVQAHAKANRQPATKELTKTLSARMLPFTVPAREHSSVVSLGVYALCTTCICILEICCVGFERG
jgi:hypothetical protein